MHSVSSFTNDSTFRKFIDFNHTQTKEQRSQDGSGEKVTFDVKVSCINAPANYMVRDLEEVRLFEYALAAHKLLEEKTKSISFSSGIGVNSNINATSGLPTSLPQSNVFTPSWPAATTSSNFTSLQPTSVFNQPQGASFPQTNLFNTATTSSGLNFASTFPTQASSSGFGSFKNTSFSLPSQTTSSIFGNTTTPSVSQPLPSALPSFFPAPTTQNQIPLFLPVSTLPAPNLFSSPSTSIQNQPVSQQPTYPTQYAQQQPLPPPPAQPPPHAYPPRYPYYDPWASYYRPPIPPYNPYDSPYNHCCQHMYDPYDINREIYSMQKHFMHRHPLCNRYSYEYETSHPSFYSDRDMHYGTNKRYFPKQLTEFKAREQESKDAVIHVVPTLGGIKDGKQQIVLNIEETPDNRSYIPKIFNPNSEISFTITSKDESINKSYTTNTINDAAREFAVHSPTKIDDDPIEHHSAKDLPKPDISKSNRGRKSIFDMNIKDYQVLPKVDKSVNNQSTRRTTFKDTSLESNASYENTLNQSGMVDAGVYCNKSTIEPDVVRSSFKPNLRNDKFSGVHHSFSESPSLNSTSNQTFNRTKESHSVSKFKWTPSWFLSKIIGGFTSDHPDVEISEVTDTTQTSPTKPQTFISPVSPMFEEIPSQKCKVVLKRTDYYSKPSLEELDAMTKDNHTFVHNFVVGRYNVGKVMFHGQTDVYNMDLDYLLTINEHEIEVYHDEDPKCIKPPVGFGLNKPATLTFYNIFPRDCNNDLVKTFTEDSLRDFESYLLRKTVELKGTFLEYLPDSGTFSFNVEHFTKYNINSMELSAKPRPIIEDDSKFEKTFEPEKDDSKFESDILPSYIMADFPLTIYFRVLSMPCNPLIPENYLKYPPIAWFNFSQYLSLSCQTSISTRKRLIDIKLPNQFITLKRINTSPMFLTVADVQTIFENLLSFVQFEIQEPDVMPMSKLNSSAPQFFASLSLSSGVSSIFKLLYSLCNTSPTYTVGHMDSLPITQKKHLLDWIRDTYRSECFDEANKHLSKGSLFNAVISLLSGGLFKDAQLLLIKHQSYRIASLLSMCAGRTKSRQIMLAQLDEWFACDLFRVMDKSFIKICMIIAGIYVVKCDESILIHVCEGIGWFRSFALFLQFYSDDNNPLSHAFELFVSNYTKYDALRSPLNSHTNTFDITYHILKYFATDYNYDLDMFETSSYTTNQLDYSLSWHLFIIMRTLSSLSFSSSHMVFLNYAYQLLELNYLQYAIFILTFIEVDHIRTHAISAILQKSPHLMNDNVIKFLTTLHIPINFIITTLMNLAFHEKNTKLYLHYLFECRLYSKAHTYLIKEEIPKLFVNDDKNKLHSLFCIFESSDITSESYYSNNGKLYSDLLSFLKNLLADSWHLKTLNDITRLSFSSLLNRLPLMEVETQFQILARSFIARILLSIVQANSNLFTASVVDLMINKFLPSDYVHSFLTASLGSSH